MPDVNLITGRNTDIMQGLKGNAITPENAEPAPFGERVEAEAAGGISKYVGDYIHADLDADREMLSPKLQKDMFGYDTDREMTLPMAQFTAKRKDIDARIEAANNNANMLQRLGSGGVSFMLDPAQLATMFIPGVGEAKMATLFGKVGGRAAAGAATMGVANAPIVAARAAVSSQSDQDYTIGQAFRDELFGMGMGAIAHPIAGAFSDTIRGTRDFDRLETMSGPEKDAAAHVGISQIAQEMPVDIRPALDNEMIRPSERETIEGVLKNPELPETMRTLMENRLKEMDERPEATPVLPPDSEQTMLDQQRLREEGTMRAIPQKVINQESERAQAAGAAPATDVDEELARLTKENSETEAELTAAHGEHPNFEETAEQLQIVKDQESKIDSIYTALSNCFMGGGTDVVE